MARLDYKVCHYFVEDSDCFGERGGDVTEGVEELFYYFRFYRVFRGVWSERREEREGEGRGKGTFGFEI